MKDTRISKEDYYLNIAKVVSERSPCLRMQVGCIIVKDDAIVSSGYNGPARKEPHCIKCHREGKEHKSEYTVCPAVHAEENAIINAAREGVSVKGGIMYLYNKYSLTPCYRCKRALVNSGIQGVVVW